MNNFFQVTEFLPASLRMVLNVLPQDITDNTYEIRMRVNKPLITAGKYGILFLNKDLSYSSVDYKNAYCVSEDELNDTVSSVCRYSVYSHQNDIMNGFVTFGKGNRAGFAGNAVTENGKIIMLNDITGINIRIASDSHDLPCEIRKLLFSFSGILIAGPPCSGKTTVLKKIAETVSSDFVFGFQKTAVIDERYEMHDIRAVNCDILSGYTKAKGIEHAVRTLSPQTVICDEITSKEETEKMAEGMYCGVTFIASMHLSSFDDMKNSPLFNKILNLNVFEYVVLLGNGERAGKVEKILRTEEIKNDTFFCNNCSDSFVSCRFSYNP